MSACRKISLQRLYKKDLLMYIETALDSIGQPNHIDDRHDLLCSLFFYMYPENIPSD